MTPFIKSVHSHRSPTTTLPPRLWVFTDTVRVPDVSGSCRKSRSLFGGSWTLPSSSSRWVFCPRKFTFLFPLPPSPSLPPLLLLRPLSLSGSRKGPPRRGISLPPRVTGSSGVVLLGSFLVLRFLPPFHLCTSLFFSPSLCLSVSSVSFSLWRAFCPTGPNLQYTC